MALVDANYRFVYADVGGEGRQSDGGLWQQSKLRKRIEKESVGVPSADKLPGSEKTFPYVIVGDDAFPLGDHLMKPFSRRDLTHPQRVFNYRLSRPRRCSENAFGILASRFRLFLLDINTQPENAIKFVLAGLVLHNFLRERCGNMYIPPGAVDSEDANNQVVPGDRRRVVHIAANLPASRNRNSSAQAKAARLDLAEYFMSAAGSVPWQEKSVSCNFVEPRPRP